MTRALAFVFVVGCAAHPSSAPPDQGGSLCPADLVFSRDGRCLPPDEVREVHISWTVSGAPASVTTCAAAPNLVLDLRSGSGASFGFEPVPCAEGMFTIDRLGTDYDTVHLGRASDRALPGAMIDAAGHAMLNLPY
jgi:hypothetical protein